MQTIDETSFDIESLTEKQQIRLTHVLDEYLQSLEQGVSFDVESVCEDEPELQRALQIYLEKLNSLYGLADSGSRQSNSIPQTLGAFSLIREIGRGGMGIVYEATQAGVQRRVALKLLPLAATLDKHQIARFKNESRAAGGLQHSNIVPVFSVGEAEGVHYYAMQLIEGESMDQWIATRRDPESSDEPESVSSSNQANTTEHLQDDRWKSIVRWAVDAAEALHHAHETGVIHRDVKPSNLMLDQDGKIWITDFGLARFPSDLSLTRPGDVVGTMRYMSPEQASGQSALVDGRTDIYSLAATIYELLTLQPAHPGDDGPSILKTIDQHNVTPLRQISKVLPRDLETVIAKAMAKRRDERYETAHAFAEDLRRILADEPTLARPPTIIDQATRMASKHRNAVLVSILVGALGFVGFAISTAMIAATAERLDQSEQLARGAVDRLSQMAELLADIPAAESVRRRLLLETLDYYQQFAEDASDQPGLRRDLAITYGKIGEYQSELGASDEAIDAMRSSEQIYALLAAENSFDPQAKLDWSVSQNNLAESLHRAGQLEEAARTFARAIDTQQRLSNNGLNDFVSSHLATTLNNLGRLLANTGATKEAEEHYLRAIERLKPVAGKTLTPERQQQQASILANLCGLLTESEPQRAIQFAQEALSNQTETLEKDPGNAKLATQVVVTLNALGAAQSRNDQNEAAIITFRRAVEVSNQLLARWPDQPTYRRDLVISMNQLGLSLSKTNELSDARSAFEQAISHQRPLAKQFESDAETHSMLGGVLNNLGFLLTQLGDPVSAANCYNEAVKHQAVATELAPEVARYRDYLEKHQHNLAEIKEAT